MASRLIRNERARITAGFVFLVTMMFFALAIERAWHYENCITTYEDSSSYNHCTKEKQNVPW